MILSFCYLMTRALLRVLLPRTKFRAATEAELLVLRHELGILRRQVVRPKLNRRDRILLASASRVLPKTSWSTFLVTPQTILRWHRELVRRKWTYRDRAPGRPPTSPEVRKLVIRLARDNPRWGCMRIKGELKKLGVVVAVSTIRSILRTQAIPPAPRRSGPTWRQFIRAQARGIVACDFFTARTAWLKTLYVFFFIHLETRRILLVKATSTPNSQWVAQQARNLIIEQPHQGIDFVLRDRDAKYSGVFDEVFLTEGAEVLLSPIRCPNANAHAERWVRTVRQECLDHLLIVSRRHLDKVLAEFVRHYNRARPHRGLELLTPEPRVSVTPTKLVPRFRTRKVLGGLINEYEIAA